MFSTGFYCRRGRGELAGEPVSLALPGAAVTTVWVHAAGSHGQPTKQCRAAGAVLPHASLTSSLWFFSQTRYIAGLDIYRSCLP